MGPVRVYPLSGGRCNKWQESWFCFRAYDSVDRGNNQERKILCFLQRHSCRTSNWFPYARARDFVQAAAASAALSLLSSGKMGLGGAIAIPKRNRSVSDGDA